MRTLAPNRRSRRARGFTLLEVMAAMMVFLVGVVGVLALFASSLALHRDATQRTIVAQASEEVRTLIEETLAEWVATGAADLPTIGESPIQGHPGYFYSAELTADPSLGVRGGVLANIRVYVRDAGQEKGESFTLFARPQSDPSMLIREARGERVRAPAGAGNEESNK